jgi:L-asparaginase II
VHVAVVDARAGRVAHTGDPSLPTFFRSAAKPLQALPLVEDGVLDSQGWSDAELALCCASHSSEPRHVETARAMLGRLGLDESALACGGHPPLREEEALRLAGLGQRPGAVHSNCSGKHAGMLALAVRHGWSPLGYERAEHPVQRRMLAEIARWTGLEPGAVRTGVDGCGVVCFQVPLEAMAGSFARFAAAAREGEAPERVVGAMTREPWMVAGTGRLCTELMVAARGAVFAKVGAEGVYCAGVPEHGLGVALKVEDGARRAAAVALIATLKALELLPTAALTALESHARPAVRNTRGEVVGDLRARLDLRGARA